jgi:hypothetical protein
MPSILPTSDSKTESAFRSALVFSGEFGFDCDFGSGLGGSTFSGSGFGSFSNSMID